MKFVVEKQNNGSFIMSNDINSVTIAARSGSRYTVIYGNKEIMTYLTREAAFDAGLRLLESNNVINVYGFIEHLAYQMDIDDNYRATIQKIVEYGLRHECLVQNQLVDWLVEIIANISVYDVILFVNDYWLNADYISLKEKQMFTVKAWVLSNEIWPETIGHVDVGPKDNLVRGYRIEVADMVGTKWLPIDCVENNESLINHFNDDSHREFYSLNNYHPTGRISFMGYFRPTDNGEYDAID